MKLVRPLAQPLVRRTRPPTYASGRLTFNGNVLAEETIRIGEAIYTFVPDPANAFEVAIGSSASITILNLTNAVNATHPDVTASQLSGVMVVTAKVAGPAGNSIVTESTAPTATWGAPTLEGGS